MSACAARATPPAAGVDASPASEPLPAEISPVPVASASADQTPTEVPSIDLPPDAEPSVSVIGEELSFAGRAVGRIERASSSRTFTRLRDLLDSARRRLQVKHETAFPTALPIELDEHHPVGLCKRLLKAATAAGFSRVELSVHSSGASERVSLNLHPPLSQDARLNKLLHVDLLAKDRYQISWREVDTIVSSLTVDSPAAGNGAPSLLAKKINEEWLVAGSHRAATDPTLDVAILHADDALPLASVLVVVAALRTPLRDATVQGRVVRVPAFDLSFALD